MTKGIAWAVPKDRYQKTRMKTRVMRTGTYSILDLPTSGSEGKKIHWGQGPGGRCLRRHEPAGSGPWGFMPAGIVPGAAAPNKVLGMILAEGGIGDNHASGLRRSNPLALECSGGRGERHVSGRADVRADARTYARKRKRVE